MDRQGWSRDARRRINALAGMSLVAAILVAAAKTIGGAQAYYVRQLSPGWPAQFHGPPPKADEVVQISVAQLQMIGIVLSLAILCLVALTLSLGGTKKKGKMPHRRR